MTAMRGQALCGADSEMLTIKWVGEIRYPMAPRLEAAMSVLLEELSFTSMCIDLRDATVVDSTALGLLARLARFMLERVGRRAILVYEPGDVCESLLTVGFDTVFVMVQQPPGAAPKLVELCQDVEPRSLGVTMLEAHEELMSLNERNAEEFRVVVGMLRAEVEG